MHKVDLVYLKSGLNNLKDDILESLCGFTKPHHHGDTFFTMKQEVIVTLLYTNQSVSDFT